MEEISEKLNRYELFQLAANVLNADHLDELYLKKEFLLENVDSNVLNSVFFKKVENFAQKGRYRVENVSCFGHKVARRGGWCDMSHRVPL